MSPNEEMLHILTNPEKHLALESDLYLIEAMWV